MRPPTEIDIFTSQSTPLICCFVGQPFDLNSFIEYSCCILSKQPSADSSSHCGAESPLPVGQGGTGGH